MNDLSVDLKFTSPAFIGGADHKAKAELRVASLRGLLRFWWRASQPPMGIAKLREKENELFGSTDAGQSKFLLRVEDESTSVMPSGKRFGNGLGYLGYGISEYKREARSIQTVRDALEAGGEFTLRLLFKKDAEAYRKELLDALWCLAHLGGIGSRSRRGFGSVVVAEGEGFPPPPASPEELRERIEQKFRDLNLRERGDLSEFTALSRQTAVTIWQLNTKSWEQALQMVGREFNGFRSSQTDTPQFPDDRDIIRDYAFKGTTPDHSPERAVFGLPHNYFFKQTGTQINIGAERHNRRASPLFIHLHELRGGELVAVFTMIPAAFLPDGEKIKIGHAGRQREKLVPPPPDFTPIRDFLLSLDALEVKI